MLMAWVHVIFLLIFIVISALHQLARCCMGLCTVDSFQNYPGYNVNKKTGEKSYLNLDGIYGISIAFLDTAVACIQDGFVKDLLGSF